ncbi:MAG TPA: hypothetical protein PKK86_04020, partial [Candidatus Syntrophosphaera sp.]|nr:hypothetical protein [Candidatus Syntrophosphaera sp.]
MSYRIWRAETSSYSAWIDVPLIPVGGNNYTATIPETAFAAGDSILYVIRAKDVNGNEHDEPLNGRHDPFWLYAIAPQTPVELSSFTASISATNFVNLTWVTQSETGVSGFYVLRNTMDDLATAVTLNELIPATNTSQLQTYMYQDNELYEDGTYWYWLQNLDIDGTVDFHGPISVVWTNDGSDIPNIQLVTELRAVYPNPFNPRAY